jgi:hypothetical protein
MREDAELARHVAAEIAAGRIDVRDVRKLIAMQIEQDEDGAEALPITEETLALLRRGSEIVAAYRKAHPRELMLWDPIDPFEPLPAK